MSGQPPRPGPVLGAYPERDAPPTGRFEQFVDQIVGGLRALAPKGAGRWRSVVRRVGARAGAYGGLDDQGLAEAVLGLRRRLRAEGLKDAVCIDAFALIREQAARVLGMRPYDVQVLGGWVMLRGRVAEMQTGEGKTLTATLPAATAAMAGVPVHIITVNDYLVRRDAELMGPLYRALGLSVGAVVEGMSAEARRAAYGCDIVYCTNKQLVFDYLRDRLVRGGLGEMRMRLDGLFGARAIGERLLLRGLCFAILDEADSVLVDEARTPLIISREADAGDQLEMYHEALALADGLKESRDYRLDPVRREVELTEPGKAFIAEAVEDRQGIWAGTRRREELVRQALYARHLLLRDRDYLVKDARVQIIDDHTGRLMPDRSWERGLHQLVEAKEGCEVGVPNETLARISYQRFFRRYLLLGGMTGTAREVSAELWSVYRLALMRIPTNRPLRRRRLGGIVLRGTDAKWAAVVERIGRLHERGQPVLAGTASVGASEQLSGLLHAAGIPHRVLNARQDRDEAETIAEAGRAGAVTVATNMAGRGTDIKLGPGVAELGGLHVIATERHESGRIDRQLYGRCARQGDPGSFEYLVSLEDGLIIGSPWRRLVPLVPTLGRNTGILGRVLVRRAQRGAEARHGRIRRQLLRLDEQMGRMLAFSGRME